MAEDKEQWAKAHRWRGKIERRHRNCIGPFKELIEAGCAEVDLFILLINLENSIVRRLGRTSMNKQTLTQLAKQLKKWALEIQRFNRSTIAGIVEQGILIVKKDGSVELVSMPLPMQLRQLAEEIERVAVMASKTKNVWESRALMLLEDHVRTATGKGKPHHKALNRLASAVLGRPVSVRERADRCRKILAKP